MDRVLRWEKIFSKRHVHEVRKKERIKITLKDEAIIVKRDYFGIKVTIRKEKKKKKVWVEKRWHELNKWEDDAFEGKQNIKEKKTSKRRHLSPKLKSDIIFRIWLLFWPPSIPILYIWTSKKSKWPMKEIKKRKKLIILWKYGRRKWENCNFDNLII